MIQTLFGSVQQEPNLLDRLKAGIQKTRAGLVDRLEDAIAGRKEIDADVLEEVEYALITADIGVNTASEILESIRQRVDRKQVGDAQQIKQLIAQHLLEVLEAAERPVPHVTEPPAVVMVVGVNGSGKTTTIGKLASRYKAEGRSVLLCAADTFRAAAIEQLEVWGTRTSTDVIRQSAGADPSAVLFDALQAAKARKVDYVIVDTAGRLHTKTNLDGRARKNAPHRGQGDPDRAARGVAGAGCDHRAERSGAGAPLHRIERRHGTGAHQAGWNGQGRHRGGHRARAESAHPLRRRRRTGRRSAALRAGQIHRVAICAHERRSGMMMKRWNWRAPGVGRTSPNPAVGAVLVKDGEIVGRGFHTYAQVKHAEILALDEAGDRARGATLYVTLEPCSHQGRTPPCADALVQAGVTRVVAAMEDPNPRWPGKDSAACMTPASRWKWRPNTPTRPLS